MAGSHSGLKIERSEAPLAAFYQERQPWLDEAICAGSDPRLFFEDTDYGSWEERAPGIAHARSMCAACPGRQGCAEQALVEEGDTPAYNRYGFRAGMTPEQRESIHRRGGLNGRDPIKLIAGKDGRRRVPPVPDEGDQWNRHHTTLARKVMRWLDDFIGIGEELPPQAKICEILSERAQPMRRVLDALVQDGTLDCRGNCKHNNDGTRPIYVRRREGVAVASWLPLHLRHTNRGAS